MKKFLFFVLSIFIISSCNNPEGKAKKLVKEHLKLTMNDFSSYEPLEFSEMEILYSYYRFDSIYSNLSSDYSANLDILKTYQELMDKVNENNRIYGRIVDGRGPFTQKLIKDLEDENDLLLKKMKEYKSNYNPKQIGYQIFHKFRGTNAFGGKILVEWLFYFDKDLTTVTDALDEEAILKLTRLKELDLQEKILGL
jgi:hypothetical protein